MKRWRSSSAIGCDGRIWRVESAACFDVEVESACFDVEVMKCEASKMCVVIITRFK